MRNREERGVLVEAAQGSCFIGINIHFANKNTTNRLKIVNSILQFVFKVGFLNHERSGDIN
jgi:hypothetical protein